MPGSGIQYRGMRIWHIETFLATPSANRTHRMHSSHVGLGPSINNTPAIVVLLGTA